MGNGASDLKYLSPAYLIVSSSGDETKQTSPEQQRRDVMKLKKSLKSKYQSDSESASEHNYIYLLGVIIVILLLIKYKKK